MIVQKERKIYYKKQVILGIVVFMICFLCIKGMSVKDKCINQFIIANHLIHQYDMIKKIEFIHYVYDWKVGYIYTEIKINDTYTVCVEFSPDRKKIDSLFYKKDFNLPFKTLSSQQQIPQIIYYLGE
ncbi:hypothetical protein KG091_00120 [Carnobacteriaceae bacterium zg-ZUI78]|nr:hypothetical protein [Carnobacteriaceae bacterium zg-ZUI78]